MDAKTLKALKGSIKKWEKIIAGTGVDKGGDNCPLCKACGWNCRDCPVMTIGELGLVIMVVHIQIGDTTNLKNIGRRKI